MAILNNLIVRGATRCLNTLYANSLQVDSQTISGNLTVNGYTYMGYSTSRSDTKLSVAGITNNQWYRSSGAVGWYNDSYSGGIYMTDSTYVRTYNNKAFLAINGLYTGASAQYYLNSNGKLNAVDGVFSNNLNVGYSIVARNVSVTNTLRAAKYDLQTVTQMGTNGTLYVAPSIQFPTSNTISVTTASTSITIIDTNITSDVMAGVVWRPSARVKISGTINGVVTGTVDGTITSINTSSKTMVIGNLSGGNWSSVVAGTYTKDKIENLNIMMYETYQNSTYYPVGILLTSYGAVTEHTDGTAKTYIDIYGGSTTKPVVRLGNMTGLDAINGVTPSGWGLYTSNGYFSGLIVSTSGKIGGWSLSTNSLTTGTWGSSGSAMLCTGSTGQKAIGGSPASTSGWVFTAGANFGVTSSGALYANSAHISGEITATSGTIGGASITDGTLTVPAAQVNGELTAATINGSKITANTITASQIATNAITADELAANAVTSAKIKAGEVKATNIASNAVTADKLDATTINASNKLTVGAMTTTDQNNILNSNIQIGGTNLLKNSNDLTKWGKESGLTVTWDSTVNMYKVVDTSHTSSRWGIYQDLDIKPNTTYTFSIWGMKSEDTYIASAVGTFASSLSWPSTNSSTYTTTMSRSSVTFTSGADHLKCRVYLYLNSTADSSKTGYFYRPKLEEGNKTTDWSPAPEDIDVHKYVTDIDSNKGITIKPADASGNDYLQMNSSAINFYRNNVETLKIEDSAIRVGKLGNSLRNVYITDSVVQIRNNTSVLAEYGSSIKLYNPTTTNVAVEISSTGASFNGNVKATSLSTGTKTASTTGKGTYIDSNGNIYVGDGNSNNFTVTSEGAMTAKSGTIGKYTITSTYLYTGTGSSQAGIGGNQAFWAGSTNSDSAPFHVSYTGVLNATGATISGNITATSGTIGGASITDGTLIIGNANIDNVNASKINAGDIAAARIQTNLISAINAKVSDISALTATLGGFQVDNTAIHTKNVEITSNADNSIALSSADFTRTINSTSRSGLRLAIGDKFGITGDGILYASNAIISGTVNATAFSYEDDICSAGLSIMGGFGGFYIRNKNPYSQNTCYYVYSSTTAGEDVAARLFPQSLQFTVYDPSASSQGSVTGEIYFEGTPGSSSTSNFRFSHGIKVSDIQSLDARMLLKTSTTSLTLSNTNNIIVPTSDNATYLGNANNRWKAIYSVDTTVHSSDIKNKDVLGSIDFAEDFIMSLNPIKFMWKDGDHRRTRMGFIAQEVAQTCKDLNQNLSVVTASYSNFPDMDYLGEEANDADLVWGVSEEQLIAPIVAVVQKQNKRIEQLENIIAELTKRG